jgi:SAM-dependent methyltransferase
MFDRVLAQVRRLRRRTAGWSVRDDRAFHDSLFGAASHDPFDRSYPGYVTIRRFADLASDRLGDARRVLDLGCGPGEITCELARRHPGVEFTGVDHSDVAVDRAARHAERFGLANVRFHTADLTSFAPASHVDLVTMFDAFHHLVDPAAFVTRVGAQVDRFFLIEPAGDALGRWRRALDFDWLPCELDKIRARIEHALGAGPARVARAGEEAREEGRAIENRYPEADYERFFAGFALEIAGTVAGFDVYPPAPHESSAWRAHAMDGVYHAIVQIDRDLHARGLDRHAKHWTIHAVRGAAAQAPRATRTPAFRDDDSADWRVQGAFDAAYSGAAVPAELPHAQEISVEVGIRNLSWRPWTSERAERPILISYHWLDSSRRAVEYDGLRTPLPRPLAPGDACDAAVRLRTPALAGSYLLEIDLVEEGVSWFSAAGVPPLRLGVRVR